MKQILLIIFFGLILSNCTVKYKVVGKYEEFNEVFIGTVNSDLMTGTSVIEVETVPSKMKCNGNSRITFIPASNYLIPGYCGGQKGVATLMCSLTGRVDATFTAKSCTKGYGTGFDKEGRMFAFTFGFKEEEAKIEIDRLMAEVKNKPDLPIYEPEKVRKEKGFSTGTGFFISNEGHMITNYHVIKNANKITVSINDKELVAKVIAQDKVNDIAIIKIDNVENISALPIIKAKNSDVGELINYNDLINNNINKIKISITNFNDPLNIFTVKKSFDENFNGIILLNKKNVFFKIDNNGEYIECKYKILH